ncbi:hypothetical protein RRG08_051588 [Elysia crispata]|uniref:Plethodontid modulating factor n=1 Tax=Elysia crispata TaxID=231223 RepID=A0AAE1A2R5_9GAST|nr:hypothetical protein RRG08_051588 [Elysia crispata]
MNFPLMLAIVLSMVVVETVATDSGHREPCRREWCSHNSLHKTKINGSTYCCLDKEHRYMIVEYVPGRSDRLDKKCFCRFH